jgi:hypothetical protein
VTGVLNVNRLVAARQFGPNSVYAETISAPTRIAAAGTKPKLIEEFIRRVNSGDDRLRIAHMRSPRGWVEPGQTPEFDEYTMVLRGKLQVTHRSGSLVIDLQMTELGLQ